MQSERASFSELQLHVAQKDLAANHKKVCSELDREVMQCQLLEPWASNDDGSFSLQQSGISHS